jgi:predicted transcriptional regulator
MPACDHYDLAENQLKAFTRSAVRTKIMLRLMNVEMTAGELEKDMNIRASTILHAMKELISEDLAKKTGRGYSLTNVGRVQALLLDELVNAIVILDQQKNFWLTHDISGIPLELLAKIGMLSQSEILKGDHAAILKTQEFWASEVVKSKEVAGVSPIIIPEYPKVIAAAIDNGANVRLILTKTIMNIVRKEYHQVLEVLLENENFRLYSLDMDIKMAFTVTDSYLSLGLFRIDGGYDVGSDLNCIGERARDWGMELFECYLKMSEEVENI